VAKEVEPEVNPRFIPEEQWTAQMVGKHFLLHHEVVKTDQSALLEGDQTDFSIQDAWGENLQFNPED